jgi:rRNA maturation endonuclease Nob1
MYKCFQCENEFEKFKEIKDQEVCPNCGASNEIYSFEIDVLTNDVYYKKYKIKGE